MEPLLGQSAVIGLAALALALFLPRAIIFLTPVYGTFGFSLDWDNRVTFAEPDAVRAGIGFGDTIDYASMPLETRYAGHFFSGGALGRLPLPGVRVSFPIVHNGIHRSVARVATVHIWPPWWRNHLGLLALEKDVTTLVLVLTGVALVLVRPTRMTEAFYLYAIGSALAKFGPGAYSFLPMAWFITLNVLTTAIGLTYPLGFVLLAARLPADSPSARRRLLESVAPYLLVILIPLGFGLDLASGVSGKPVETLVYVDTSATSAIFLVGLLSLTPPIFRTGLRPSVGVRWALALLAVAALGELLGFASFLPLTYAIEHAIERLTSTPIFSWVVLVRLAGFNIVVSLVFAYVLVRHRIVDVRLVVSRSLAYGLLAGAIVIAFATLNFVFAKEWAQFALAIPFEIVAAVGLGYRLSGFSDIATTLSLAQVDAPAAAVLGRRGEEREILARALGRAERTRADGLIAEVRARAAFGAWIAGEDDEFERQLGALDVVIGKRPARGLRFFAVAAHGRLDGREPGTSDLSEWSARAYLIGCGTSDDASAARRFAAAAVAVADISDTPFLRGLARVACAEFSPQDRAALLSAAADISSQINAPPLMQAVAALSADRDDIGVLAPFVKRRLRSVRAATPILDVSFLTATVRCSGSVASLRDSESALLFAIARNPEPANVDRLVDELWPDLDGDGAANAFRVCLHRLRKGLGNSRAVVRSARGYSLCTGAVVDLWPMTATVATLRTRSMLEPQDRAALLEMHARLRAGRGARAAQPVWFSRYAAGLAEFTREAAWLLGRDALHRGDVNEALRLAHEMLEDESADEGGRELAIRAHLASGDRSAAMREYRRYRDVMEAQGNAHGVASFDELIDTTRTFRA